MIRPLTQNANTSKPASGAPDSAPLNGQKLYDVLSKLHREQLKPVGPLENTLVETIVHNCYQIHHTQLAERDLGVLNLSPKAILDLTRLARYRAHLERSTEESLAKLARIQRQRIDGGVTPPVLAAAAAAAAVPQPAVRTETERLPVPRPVEHPPARATQPPSGPNASAPTTPGRHDATARSASAPSTVSPFVPRR